MKQKKEEFIQSIQPNDTIIVAFSGGPDSVFLLTLLNKIKKEKNLLLIVAYVNHQARKSCVEEEVFVKKYCQEHHLKLETIQITSYQKKRFTEQEARQIRYQFFCELVHKYHANYVMTAHHGDDLIETVLMKIIRGSTLTGLEGIKKETYINNCLFIRPLLPFTKEEILKDLNYQNIAYIVDETNELDTHIRNRLRHHVVPFLKKEDPNIHQKFLKFSQELKEVNAYINRELQTIETKIKHNQKTNILEFLQLDRFLQKEYLKKELASIYQEHISKITPKIIMEILKRIQSQKNQEYPLPLKRIFAIHQGHFYFYLQQENPTYCIECKNEVILPNGGLITKKNAYSEKSNFEIHLNSSQITLPLYLTTRKKGMKMQIKNLNGSKKVKDIFIDEKIAQSEKDQIPIMVDAKGTVLWILGVKKSLYDLDKQENYDIIYKYERKEP